MFVSSRSFLSYVRRIGPMLAVCALMSLASVAFAQSTTPGTSYDQQGYPGTGLNAAQFQVLGSGVFLDLRNALVTVVPYALAIMAAILGFRFIPRWIRREAK